MFHKPLTKPAAAQSVRWPREKEKWRSIAASQRAPMTPR
ncbi:hypothetical protein WQQ_05620 [Hydrocarboniphaga effusa AP103]|uniref:Uncharacterized protein n=1 Tax=Hydrocarboniphaga effusa AP103 TaxID=1172194 RepID=I8T8Y4_9GAMM|nr:hypothetical protein WQQ_05620 [Hydrocarboniphaga effusa AP103]